VLLHEVAHMWFYGMVGNSQFRDPWLDEAFASYAESVASPVEAGEVAEALARPGEVGRGDGRVRHRRGYFGRVYRKGGAALLAARETAGAEAFDAALRCYVDANAWTIATPTTSRGRWPTCPRRSTSSPSAGALDEDDLPRDGPPPRSPASSGAVHRGGAGFSRRCPAGAASG
jgi:hypothetical protein